MRLPWAPARCSTQEILAQLDRCAKTCKFPVLSNANVFPIGLRLHAYRDDPRWSDDDRWVIVIECLGYSPKGGGHFGIANVLSLYGNCLKRPPGTANEDFLEVTADGPEGPTFDEEFEEYVHDRARTIQIREKVIQFDVTPQALARKGIELVEPPRVRVFELMRSLVPEYKNLLLATEEELRERVPPDLPQLLVVEQWRHPELPMTELPSITSTFRMLASVLEANDVSLYKPTEAPNTHWQNWPRAGSNC